MVTLIAAPVSNFCFACLSFSALCGSCLLSRMVEYGRETKTVIPTALAAERHPAFQLDRLMCLCCRPAVGAGGPGSLCFWYQSVCNNAPAGFRHESDYTFSSRCRQVIMVTAAPLLQAALSVLTASG
jgi:hypothetical protein